MLWGMFFSGGGFVCLLTCLWFVCLFFFSVSLQGPSHCPIAVPKPNSPSPSAYLAHRQRTALSRAPARRFAPSPRGAAVPRAPSALPCAGTRGRPGAPCCAATRGADAARSGCAFEAAPRRGGRCARRRLQQPRLSVPAAVRGYLCVNRWDGCLRASQKKAKERKEEKKTPPSTGCSLSTCCLRDEFTACSHTGGAHTHISPWSS